MEKPKMKEELTASMHMEFLGDEMSEMEMKILGVYGAMSRLTPEEALAKYGLTKEEYNANVNKYLMYAKKI